MKKSKSYFAYFITLFGAVMVAVMIVLDAVLFPLTTDYEPWYYFLFMWLFIVVTIAGLILSFYWRNIFTTSKKENMFSYIVLTFGFFLFGLTFADEQKYLISGALGFGFMIIGIASLLSTSIGLKSKRVPSINITQSFPKAVRPSVEAVIKWLKRRRQLKAGNVLAPNPSSYYHDFNKIFIPNMVNFSDIEYVTNDFNAQMIYYCLQTRNRDGHIREKYIKKILKSDCPRFVIPFIIEASTDRVVEVVKAIYDEMSEKLKDEIGNYYKNDLRKFRHDYSKTISYWDEYYAADYRSYKDYPGYKLFTECYGYKKRYYKEANRISDNWNKLWDLYAEGKLEEIPSLLCDYYSGVMGEGHSGFIFNVDNGITDYIEKLKGVLDEGLYNNLISAVGAYGTKSEDKVCNHADAYLNDHEDEIITLLKKYADSIRLKECGDR